MSASQSSHLNNVLICFMFCPFLLWDDAQSGLDAFSFSLKMKIVDGYTQGAPKLLRSTFDSKHECLPTTSKLPVGYQCSVLAQR